ncbi:MAG: FeoA family protein [Flavobacteriaceae bacterium]|nr:FeoA family protein [Flavobacteriaceae bacterium]
MPSIADLKRGQKAVIAYFEESEIPFTLIEMGCLPGNNVELVAEAPAHDPIYLIINDMHLAIRRETARFIPIEIVE